MLQVSIDDGIYNITRCVDGIAKAHILLTLLEIYVVLTSMFTSYRGIVHTMQHESRNKRLPPAVIANPFSISSQAVMP